MQDGDAEPCCPPEPRKRGPVTSTLGHNSAQQLHQQPQVFGAGAQPVAAPLLSGASPELAGIAALAGVIGLCGAAFDWPRG